jgi:hypothetical protein
MEEWEFPHLGVRGQKRGVPKIQRPKFPASLLVAEQLQTGNCVAAGGQILRPKILSIQVQMFNYSIFQMDRKIIVNAVRNLI